MDLIITICVLAADETCPIWPGAPLPAHWDIPEQSAAAQPGREEAVATA